ncbi:MAG: hypothetical protein IJC26_05125 [Clostridia bacterium]|nr:hypothetical protein [Clostridia bacterium]
MKKLLALICLLTMLLPLCACSSGLATETPVTEQSTAETKTEEKKEEEKGEIVYPDSFAVGFSRVDITPQTPIPIYNTTATGVHDPLWLTCTALWDGKTAALIYSVDSWFVNVSTTQIPMKQLEKKFGIKPENVMFNSTHAHSAPNIASSENPEIIRYCTYFYKQALAGAEEALRDLDVVEKTFTGKANTEPGITFVRRYLMDDGSYRGIASSNPNTNYVSHETEADPEMRTIRFDRKNKKDVLMLNHQTHYGGATSLYPDQISADFITLLREQVEKDLDCHFVYQYGASGNVNFISFIEGERKYASYPEAIPSLAQTVKDAVTAEKETATGRIRSAKSDFVCTVLHDPEERIRQAQEIADTADEAQKGVLISQYGFYSKHEASAVLTRNRLAETEAIPLSVITCGEICFAAFPYEMFDASGKQLRDASPYEMTFVCSLTNGAFGYIPTKEAIPHGQYEVLVTRFVEGTAEQLVAESLRMLNECKNAA